MLHLFPDGLSHHGPTKPKIIHLYVASPDPSETLSYLQPNPPVHCCSASSVAQLLGMWASTWCTFTASFSTCGNVLPQFSLHEFTSVLPVGLASPTEHLTGTKALIFLGYK